VSDDLPSARSRQELLDEVRRRAAVRRRRRQHRLVSSSVLAVVAVAVVISLAVVAGHGSGSKTLRVTGSPPTTSMPSTTVPSTTVPTSSAPTTVVPTTVGPTSTVPTTTPPTTVPSTTTASLPLVVCPTTTGVTGQQPVSLPSTVSVPVSSGQAGHLAVYTDNQGIMKLVAPVGWSCQAEVAADGSSGVDVHPTGEAPSAISGSLSAGSTVTAVVGFQTGRSPVQAAATACALFPAAATATEADLGKPCANHPGAAEQVDQISPTVVGFEDPPGTAGTGSPSGGAYAANGVMTYDATGQSPSWTDTCTLPGDEKAVCTTALNAFLTSYGSS
jgi:hypothetical protein